MLLKPADFPQSTDRQVANTHLEAYFTLSVLKPFFRLHRHLSYPPPPVAHHGKILHRDEHVTLLTVSASGTLSGLHSGSEQKQPQPIGHIQLTDIFCILGIVFSKSELEPQISFEM